MTGTVGSKDEQDTGNNRFANTEKDDRGKSWTTMFEQFSAENPLCV
jgi:hypothetical protein